jgi:hypothetical protein
MSDASEIVFRPRYGFRRRAAMFVMPIMALLAAFLAVAHAPKNPKDYLPAAFFVGGSIGFAFVTIRRIRFGPDICVDRYLLPPRRFDYTDIEEIGLMTIKTRRGKISPYGVDNSDELGAIFEDLVKTGRMSESQIGEELALKEALGATTMIYAIFIALPLHLVLLFVNRPSSRLTGGLRFFAIFAVVYAVTYWLVKKRFAAAGAKVP